MKFIKLIILSVLLSLDLSKKVKKTGTIDEISKQMESHINAEKESLNNSFEKIKKLSINENKFKDYVNTFEFDMYHRCSDTTKKLFELTSAYIKNENKMSSNLDFDIEKVKIKNLFSTNKTSLNVLIIRFEGDIELSRMNKKINYENKDRIAKKKELENMYNEYLKDALSLLEEKKKAYDSFRSK